MSRGDAPRRAELMRAVRHGVRQLSLASSAYVGHVAQARSMPDADVHALGIVKASDERDSGLSAGELARTLGLSPGAVTALLTRLESAGHLSRQRSADDGRRVELHGTPLAHSTSHAEFLPLSAAYDEALADVPDDELAAFVAVMERLTAATSAAMNDAAPGPAPRAGRGPGAW